MKIIATKKDRKEEVYIHNACLDHMHSVSTQQPKIRNYCHSMFKSSLILKNGILLMTNLTYCDKYLLLISRIKYYL